MPYKQGDRLPGERASKLGHLEVLKSDLVNKLIKEFEENNSPSCSSTPIWEQIPEIQDPLTIIFGIDGSLQFIESEVFPYKRLAFVKTALLRIDQWAISKVNKESPHPLDLRDILSDSAIYHATVFPLKHISIPGFNTYHAIRQIIFESLKDYSLNSEPLETLKWIAYEKWDGKKKNLPFFECPHCETQEATLFYDSEVGKCPKCKGDLFLTDMLGFHQDMAPDFASDSVATSYMQVHEVLLLFTGIRYYWEKNREILNRCLFVKDGPLSIRAQYSKIVNPIRRFMAFARDQGQPVYIIGQEKSGRFYDHLELIAREAPLFHLFIPKDKYIKEEIQHRPNTGAPYGKDTNYGAKIFFKINQFHQMVLNIPTGEFVSNPAMSDLIGVNKIFSTLPTIISNRFEGALLPVELANGIASLSTYPSSHILKLFIEAQGL
jgi:hypothetical protein